MPSETEIRGSSQWMARGFMLPDEITALRVSAKTTSLTDRLTYKPSNRTIKKSLIVQQTRDALFDGSDAHFLNDAGDAFESPSRGVGP